jgi:uncharacterized membrane protein YbhN (UPF0104 family)
VNAILVAFFVVKDHMLIFARQLVTWIMMIISPTPGGSGFAELILADSYPMPSMQTLQIVGSLCSRYRNNLEDISYYPYLIIGASIVPGWIQKKFVRKA